MGFNSVRVICPSVHVPGGIGYYYRCDAVPNIGAVHGGQGLQRVPIIIIFIL